MDQIGVGDGVIRGIRCEACGKLQPLKIDKYGAAYYRCALCTRKVFNRADSQGSEYLLSLAIPIRVVVEDDRLKVVA